MTETMISQLPVHQVVNYPFFFFVDILNFYEYLSSVQHNKCWCWWRISFMCKINANESFNILDDLLHKYHCIKRLFFTFIPHPHDDHMHALRWPPPPRGWQSNLLRFPTHLSYSRLSSSHRESCSSRQLLPWRQVVTMIMSRALCKWNNEFRVSDPIPWTYLELTERNRFGIRCSCYHHLLF